MLECLSNIIGLSDTDCDCWDNTKPLDFASLNASSSGLYVLDSATLPINLANAGTDCSTGSIWDMAIKGREQAIRQTTKDFTLGINTRLNQRFIPFDTIGDDYYRGADTVFPSSNYAGVYIEPYKIKGATISVQSVSITFFSGITVPTNITVEVYSSRDFTTVLDSATVSVTANRQTFEAVFTSPFIIDLSNYRPDKNERLYFVYQIPVGAKPIENNVKQGCGCGSGSEYKDDPFLMVLKNVAGVQSDTVVNLGKGRFTGNMNGLVLNTNFQCDYYSWLCDLAQDPTSASSGGRLYLGMALADTLKAWATMYVIDAILKSKRINYYTMVLEPDSLIQELKRQQENYNLGIDNLVYHMPNDVTDCLICKDNKSINKSTLKI